MNQKVLESIRKSTNTIAADTVRNSVETELKERIQRATVDTAMKEYNIALEKMVDKLLECTAVAGVEAVKDFLPELAGDSEPAQEARDEIIRSCVYSGQHLKRTVRGSMEAILFNLRDGVARTVSGIIGEAAVVAALTRTTKALPIGQEEPKSAGDLRE